MYADFNPIEYLEAGSSLAEMPITGFGTLGSLARQGLRLEEGMALVLYEPNDIECEALVHFDTARKDPAGKMGAWIARFDADKVRDSTIAWETSSVHPCIVCGVHFWSESPTLARFYTDRCVHCGASVMAPMASPAKPLDT